MRLFRRPLPHQNGAFALDDRRYHLNHLNIGAYRQGMTRWISAEAAYRVLLLQVRLAPRQ
jgi:hypothetical protein